MKKITFLAIALLVMSGPAFAGFPEGLAAYKAGEYSTALREFRSSALNGDAASQTNLGLMYSKGLGVARNEAEAVKWYSLAANQGQAVAQNNLGAMYLSGSGAPLDPIMGAVWLILASENGYAAAGPAVRLTMENMTAKEKDCVVKLYAVWREKLALSKLPLTH